jgi:hypothetical protein
MEQKVMSINNLKEAIFENNNILKKWVTSQISKISIISIEWPDILPTENISTSTIYMIKNSNSEKNKNLYDEYVYNETSGWEILGQVDTGSIDMTSYYNKTEIDTLLKNYSSYTDEEVYNAVSQILS